MSESVQEQPDEQESPPTTGETKVEAEQVVVNNAPDGGGVDNNPPTGVSEDGAPPAENDNTEAPADGNEN